MLGDFLPGKLVIERGTAKDYESLARFHYIAGRPGTWAGIWVAKYRDGGAKPPFDVAHEYQAVLMERVVAIAVLSWSPLGCTARDMVLNLRRFEIKERAKWLNKNVRTISRVVVHPQFRGVGLGSELVRKILEEAPTRYVETIAAMGKVHPFFEKAGMRRVQHEGEKAYFIFDREGEQEARNSNDESYAFHLILRRKKRPDSSPLKRQGRKNARELNGMRINDECSNDRMTKLFDYSII